MNPTNAASRSDTFEYDFFISRRGPVREIATFVADTLSAHGYTVFVQDYDMGVGSDFIQRMHFGLIQARHLMVLLTEDYDQQPFTWWEFGAFASAAPPTNGHRRLVILRVSPCQPRGLFSNIVYQDLVDVHDESERRERILDAAAGISAPAPFQLLPTRLSDGLRPSSSVDDAWLRLTHGRLAAEVPFIGREREMKDLLAFAAGEKDPRAFTWQVLYGPHATGKSRLAREWLHRLAAATPGWDGGFAPDSAAELLTLLSLEPSAPTAIVIDDAATYGETAWLFLQRAARWRNPDKPVRVLLVAHQDMNPPASVGFEKAQAIRALRQTQPVQSRRTAKLFRTSQATHQPMRGVQLSPLNDVREQSALLEAVALAAARPLSTTERARILERAEGRPALLILAATDPDAWHQQLTDYAMTIAQDAAELFSPKRDGLKLLAASVLAGPFSDDLRHAIAPAAVDPERLARLFPNAVDLTCDIPQFQPDILGFHVLSCALGAIPTVERRDLARDLLSNHRDRFVARLDACLTELKPEYAYFCKLLAPNDNQSQARFAAGLDDLIATIAADPQHCLSSPSARLSVKRRDLVLAALEISAELSEHDLKRVVHEALRFAPFDGMADVIDAALRRVSLPHGELSRWLGLIGEMTHGFDEELAARISATPFRRRRPHILAELAELAAALTSRNAFDRLEAAYELGIWFESRPHDGRALLQAEPALISALLQMLVEPQDHLQTAAAWCLKKVARWPTPIAIPVEIQNALNYASTYMQAWLEDPQPFHAVGQFIQLQDFIVRCRIAEDHHLWFQDLLDLPEPDEPMPAETERAIRRIATAAFEARNPESRTFARHAEFAAILLLRAGCFEPSAAATAERALLRDPMTDRSLSTLCRVAAIRSVEAGEFLLRLLRKLKDRDDVATLVCAYALLSGRLEVVELLRPLLRRSSQPLDLDNLLDAARARTPGDPWRGPAVTALDERLVTFRVRRNGHLVHKLKAKDTSGRWAYYFVFVKPEKEALFLDAIRGNGTVDLEDYGSIIASCYGETPSDDILNHLKQKYGFDLKGP